jgi:hypothetical protein
LEETRDIKKDDRGMGLLRAKHIKAMIVLAAFMMIAVVILTWPGFNRFEGLFQGNDNQEPESFLADKEEFPLLGSEENTTRIDPNEGSVEVVEIILSLGSTHLRVRLNSVPAFRIFPGYEDTAALDQSRERLNDQLKRIYLRDDKGKEYPYQEGNYAIEHLYCSACATGVSWSSDVYLELPPLEPGANLSTLVVPLPDGSEIEINIPMDIIEEIGP